MLYGVLYDVIFKVDRMVQLWPWVVCCSRVRTLSERMSCLFPAVASLKLVPLYTTRPCPVECSVHFPILEYEDLRPIFPLTWGPPVYRHTAQMGTSAIRADRALACQALRSWQSHCTAQPLADIWTCTPTCLATALGDVSVNTSSVEHFDPRVGLSCSVKLVVMLPSPASRYYIDLCSVSDWQCKIPPNLRAAAIRGFLCMIQ